MLKHYIDEISSLEFSERNHEIPKLVAQEKGRMIERGALNSTIALEAVANFFSAEFLVRCDFLKAFIINHPNLLSNNNDIDVVTNAKAIFQNASFHEKNKMSELYKNTTTEITESLLNCKMIQQVEDSFLTKMEMQIKKNNLYIEIAYKEIALANNNKNHAIIFQPNIYGIGVNINELWGRYFKHNK